MIIKQIAPNSAAEKAGLLPGDDIRVINDMPVRDILDYHFQVSDEFLEIDVVRDGTEYFVEIDRLSGQDMGIEFDPLKIRHCGNKCVFCFVDQNPPGLRKSLYLKDEDYRLSFMFGSYFTLTNLSRKEAQRIVDQHLSPLYISVHAIDPEVRHQLIGFRGNDRMLEKLGFLTRNGIQVHTQIVLCPGYNDGAVLAETVSVLRGFYPQVLSIAVVPVGLTRHRQNLPKLDPVTVVQAQKVINWAEQQSDLFFEEDGTHFLYMADEFYLRAGIPVPPESRYDGYVQIENGIGMVRQLLDTFLLEKKKLPQRLVQKRRILLVTGVSAAPILKENILPALKEIENLDVDVIQVPNRFYGERVTVSGLLTGQDIAAALKPYTGVDMVVLPENCLNTDGIFLDDWTPEKLKTVLGTEIIFCGNHLLEIFEEDITL